MGNWFKGIWRNPAAEILRNLGNDISNMKRSHDTTEPLLQQLHSSTASLQWATKHSYLFLGHIISEETEHELNGNFADFQAQKCWLMMSYQKMMVKRKKLLRKLISCPSIEINVGSLDVDADADYQEAEMVPRIRTLDSTAVLSVASFTSLLIKFVARLDRLVEAVDELSKLAKFKQYH